MRGVRVGLAMLAAAALTGAGLAGAAGAELLRCQGPDGRVIYTDDKARCPGADPFEPKGRVHEAEPRSTPGAASRSPYGDRLERAEERRRAAEVEAGEARRWRLKRERGEEALAAIARRRSQLDQFVTWCNRGGSVVTRDDAGIKRTVRCDEIRSEYEALDDEEAEAREYLEVGLAEECRRAGCLPGWIR